jgi:hypothetical protein
MTSVDDILFCPIGRKDDVEIEVRKFNQDCAEVLQKNETNLPYFHDQQDPRYFKGRLGMETVSNTSSLNPYAAQQLQQTLQELQYNALNQTYNRTGLADWVNSGLNTGPLTMNGQNLQMYAGNLQTGQSYQVQSLGCLQQGITMEEAIRKIEQMIE